MNFSDYQHLLFERRANGVLLITLNRPEVFNATNETMHAELARVDPEAAQKILPTDPRRTVRALEVIELTGRPFSATMPIRRFAVPALLVGLRAPRAELDERIERRTRAMWATGMLKEVSVLMDAGLGANASWEDMESVGLLVYATATWDAGDLTLVLTDDGGDRTFNIPALAAANVWTWLEVDITDLDGGTGDSISDVAVLLSEAGATALGEFSVYVDIAYVWDATDEEALGVAIQQDGVLSVIDTAGGTSLAELTDYLVHYESGNDFLVYITDQSANEIVALVAY